MHSFFQVVYTTLQAVATAIFHPWFLIVIYLMYRMYKKIGDMEVTTLLFMRQNIGSKMVQSVLSGILIGIGASILLVAIGLPIHLSDYMVFLLPIAIMLAMINFRYLCFSYAGGLLGILSFILRGQMFLGVKLPDMNLDIPGIIALVGILHFMESLLILLEGAEDSIPMIIKKDGKFASAYMMQRYWPLPFALLVMEVVAAVPQGSIAMPNWWPLMKNIVDHADGVIVYSIYPITAVLGYGDIAVSMTPEQKSRRTSLSLMAYSLFLLLIAVFAPNRIWLQGLGVILMPVLHEMLIVRSQIRERNSKPLYTYPDKGVRILDLKPEGLGEKIGLRRGEINLKINGTEIENYAHMKSMFNNYFTFIWIDIIGIDGKTRCIEHQAYSSGVNDLGIIPLIQEPLAVYRLENMESVGLFKMFTGKK